MPNKKRNIFEKMIEKLSGGSFVNSQEEEKIDDRLVSERIKNDFSIGTIEDLEAELVVDAYETGDSIIIQTMLAGVKPDDLEVEIARDYVTIRGKREGVRNINVGNHFIKELYWGKFGRTIPLPHEIEPDESEATEKHGLLTIKLKKVDKNKKGSVKIKSI